MQAGAGGELSNSKAPRTRPFGRLYTRRHRALVERALASPELIEAFGDDGRSLPPGYGIGFDERVVEFPWLAAHRPAGAALDAGSTLNHAHVLSYFLPAVSPLTVVTLAPEPVAFPELGVSYLYADLRNLPFKDNLFETTISLSTLEHVGMDTSLYTGAAEGNRPENPLGEMQLAMRELRRVTKPGGRILVSVPYGRAEDHGWLLQFDRQSLAGLTDAVDGCPIETTVFQYGESGWRHSTLEEAANAEYHDVHADSERQRDGAAAARAVACLSIAV